LRDLASMAEREIAAVQLATLDELTLISNRRGFSSLSQHTLNVCRRKKLAAHVLLFDLNEFKPINDQFGHAEGDKALIAFADHMRTVFRDSDVFGRLGGDELSALITDTDDDAIELVLTRFRLAINKYNETSNRGYDLSYSVGSVKYSPEKNENIEELLSVADARMYEVKKSQKKYEKDMRFLRFKNGKQAGVFQHS